MSYIWDNYSIERKYHLKEQYDTSDIELYRDPSDGKDYVNARLRFPDLDEALHSLNKWDTEAVNAVLHYLAVFDIVLGRMMFDTYTSALISDIVNGKYGKRAAVLFQEAEPEHRLLLLKKLSDYHSLGERKNYFNQVFMEIFGDRYRLSENSAEIYYSISHNKYYCYCSADATESNVRLFELITLLFADISEEYIPVWGKSCFGIIDGQSCSRLTIDRSQIISL